MPSIHQVSDGLKHIMYYQLINVMHCVVYLTNGGPFKVDSIPGLPSNHYLWCEVRLWHWCICLCRPQSKHAIGLSVRNWVCAIWHSGQLLPPPCFSLILDLICDFFHFPVSKASSRHLTWYWTTTKNPWRFISVTLSIQQIDISKRELHLQSKTPRFNRHPYHGFII